MACALWLPVRDCTDQEQNLTAGGAEDTEKTFFWKNKSFLRALRVSAVRFSFCGAWGGGGGRDRWGSVGIEFLDGPAVDPQPEQGFLRLAVLAEDGVAGRAFEGLLHVGERVAQLFARAGAALVDGLLEKTRRVEGVRLEKAGRAVVRRGEIVGELARRRPVRVG